MATDAALDADEERLRFFLSLAFWAETFAQEGATMPKHSPTLIASNDFVRETEESKAALESDWSARRFLCLYLPCDCFNAAYASLCSLPDCGKKHRPYADPEEKLLKCGQCFRVFYCCKEHGALDWPVHKQDCRRNK